MNCSAGVGKSRLCAEFIEGCQARSILVNETHCPAHGRTVPLLPMLGLVRSFFRIEDRDSDFVRRFVRARSAREASVILIDDLHWIDPTSDEFVAQVADVVQGTSCSPRPGPRSAGRSSLRCSPQRR